MERPFELDRQHLALFHLMPPLRSIKLSGSAKAFLILLLVEYVLFMGMLVGYLFLNDWDRTAIFYSVVVGITANFMIYFAVDSVINENRILLISFFATVLVFAGMLLYSLFTARIDPENVIFFRVAIGIGAVLVAFTLIIGVFVWRSFGWRVFLLIGADTTQQRAFRLLLTVNGLLKVDILWSALLVAVCLWQVRVSAVEIALMGGWLVVVVCTVAFVLMYVLPHEGKWTLYGSLLVLALPLGAAGYFLSQLGHFEPEVAAADALTQRFRFAVALSLFVITRALLVIALWLCTTVSDGVMRRVAHLWLTAYDGDALPSPLLAESGGGGGLGCAREEPLGRSFEPQSEPYADATQQDGGFGGAFATDIQFARGAAPPGGVGGGGTSLSALKAMSLPLPDDGA